MYDVKGCSNEMYMFQKHNVRVHNKNLTNALINSNFLTERQISLTSAKLRPIWV